MAVDSLSSVHIATTSGMEVFDSKVEYGKRSCCGDVAISPEDYRFVSYFDNTGSLEVRKPDNTLLQCIDGLRYPLGLCLDQSGSIFVVERGANEVCKY